MSLCGVVVEPISAGTGELAERRRRKQIDALPEHIDHGRHELQVRPPHEKREAYGLPYLVAARVSRFIQDLRLERCHITPGSSVVQ
jgi:hypothetical protein